MSDDFEIEPGRWFGRWLHEEVARHCHIEQQGWAPERVQRVAERLQAPFSAAERLEVVVPWMECFSAFTAPGRYIYFSRRLLERCPDDETTAFIIGHEIGHHALGHLRLFPRCLGSLARIRGGWMAAAAVQAFERRLYSPEYECDADRQSLELCLTAGYEAERCLRLFDILEQIALDTGDLDLAYGPGPTADPEVIKESWWTQARLWTWQRTRGYPSLSERREQLLAHLRWKEDAAQRSAAADR